MAKILIIDDEAAILNLMSKSCEQQGHQVTAVQTGREGLTSLEANTPDLMIVDLFIGDVNGLEIIQQCSEQHPDVQIVMVTGNGSIESAVEAMRLGAFDYLTKPFELADLQRTVKLGLTKRDTPAQNDSGDFKSSAIALESGGMIGESGKISKIKGVIEKIADNDSPVLLEGEFGSGKQMVARSIHNASKRKSAPFKVLQCSALPEELLEIELFGSASSRSETIFSRAAGGTVLLEEIHLLPVRLQSKLESYLEEINTRRVVSDLPESMNVRFIASSAKPLQDCIESGSFREDLFYKISVIPIDVSPLRSRVEDIGVLAAHFLSQYAERTGTKAPEIDKYAQTILDGYNWPGNVGELQNAMERACAFAENGRIRPVDLPPKVTQKVEITDDDEKTTHHLPIGTALQEYIRKQEKLFIRETLNYNGGSREKTASMLGVSIATLYRKMGLKLERDKLMKV
ncbi:sigma-54 dependent transcriptional regulator [Verrucomicrobiales bacterium]|nr:sigma-54 dependent transcriptional regulator [Verrucomicrobiales bacterium]|tara:strand:+ start:347 stop:1720 length:1374 start_codon:yes stop_codon:yes gene_type:complete